MWQMLNELLQKKQTKFTIQQFSTRITFSYVIAFNNTVEI